MRLPLILLAAVLGCSSNEGGPMTSLMSSTIPPNDAAAPAKVETVTFAVG